jgi:DNA-directed RNA polymerase omega subunit
MANLPIEDLLPKAGGSIYRLVRMAANRAVEISEGKPRFIDKPSSDKETTIALEEIAKGKVFYKGGAAKEKPADN